MTGARWPLLDVLPEPLARRVVADARRRRFSRGEVIFHEGDSGDALHLLARGHVAIRIHTPLGDTATVRVVRPGEFFGELAVVSPGPRNAAAVALDEVETLVLSRQQLAELRVSHEQIEALIVEALVCEIRRLAEQVVELMYVPVDKRLFRRLLDLAVTFGSDGTPAADVPVTQEVLAQTAGCTRPTANRALRLAEQEGVISIERGRIHITDAAALGRRAR